MVAEEHHPQREVQRGALPTGEHPQREVQQGALLMDEHPQRKVQRGALLQRVSTVEILRTLDERMIQDRIRRPIVGQDVSLS